MKKRVMMKGLALTLAFCVACIIPQKTVSANEKRNNNLHEHLPIAQVTVTNLDTGEVHILSEGDGINVETKIDGNGRAVIGVSANVAIPAEDTGIILYRI